MHNITQKRYLSLLLHKSYDFTIDITHIQNADITTFREQYAEHYYVSVMRKSLHSLSSNEQYAILYTLRPLT